MESKINKKIISDKTTEFTVLIPAYNEEKNIINTINETVKVLKVFSPEYEILVVDDGSTDQTSKKVLDYIGADTMKVKLQSYSPNKGKGFALKYGFNYVNSRYILFLDADLDLHPSHLISMDVIMKKRSADAVIGSKRHEKSKLVYPKSRAILSNVYYFTVRTLFKLPVRDTQTGIKLFKFEVLEKCMPEIVTKRYAFDLELLLAIYRKGFKIVEAPIQLITKRQYGRIGVFDASRVFADTIRIFWRFYIKKVYGKH
jgi:glycosyltransferase involved in cell wall biosynthesis